MCFKWVAQPPRHVRAVMRSLPFPFRLPCYVSLFRTPAYVNPPFFVWINWDKPTISWCRVNNIMGHFENRHVNFLTFCLPGAKGKKVCIDIQFQKVDVMLGATIFTQCFFVFLRFYDGTPYTSDEHYGKSGLVDAINLTSRVASLRKKHKSQACLRWSTSKWCILDGLNH